MTQASQIAIIFTSISFFIYGASCLLSPTMVREFERYQLSHLRRLTGFLQLTASVSLCMGLALPLLAVLSSLFLSAMMFIATLVRFKIKDPLWAMIPALTYLLISLFISLSLFNPTS